MKLLYVGQKTELFFVEAVLVPPNKFRPMNKVNDVVAASERTVGLKEGLDFLLSHLFYKPCSRTSFLTYLPSFNFQAAFCNI